MKRLKDWLLTREDGYVTQIVECDFETGECNSRRPRFRVRPMFAWYDLWVGVFWDRKQKQLYVFPVPMLGFKIGYQ